MQKSSTEVIERILEDPSSWLADAEDVTISKSLQKANEKAGDRLLEMSIERERDWAILANQVVGREFA